MKKIVTVIGARPQFIKMGLVSKELKTQKIKEIIIHTGQHYNKNMSEIFFKELNISKPHYNLGIVSTSHSEQIAKMLPGIEKILLKHKPGMVMVYGDTNSTLAGALAAAKVNIRVAHVEAGLRSNNFSMPEEINRVVTDSVSSVFFCPTVASVRNLKMEGRKKGVYFVGDVMYDSIKKYERYIKRAPLSQDYILCTIHRAENTDNKTNLKNIFKGLAGLRGHIILPLHPRTKKCLKKYRIKTRPNIELIEPVGYVKMLSLEKNAKLIMTDSGGVQKEALIFGVPCVTLRNETEWVETLDSGMNFLAGTSPKKIVLMAKKALRNRKKRNFSSLYGNGLAYRSIVRILAKELRGEK